MGGVWVALLAEGVDRNCDLCSVEAANHSSPSSRRAWIEIQTLHSLHRSPCTVALLAEGVDRNLFSNSMGTCSSRVALLAEGVDRNGPGYLSFGNYEGRPPRGGRG